MTVEAPPRLSYPVVAVVVLSGGSIAALLADILGVAPMSWVFWLASVPAMVMLAVLAVAGPVNPELRRRIRVGAAAGAVGTLGYDLVRIPFALAGQRVFAPIESYGILIADASASSGLTSTLGWLFHLSNGVTFGIAYAAVAARRHWAWGVAWALVLESVAVFSPFAVQYGLAGQVVPIAIAYGAHLFYGYPLGRMVQKMDPVDAGLRGVGRHTVAAVLLGAALVIVVWHRPWTTPPAEREAAGLATDAAPATVVTRDRFAPEWLRVPIRDGGACVLVANHSGVRYETPFGVVAADGQSRLCFDGPGVYRVRLGSRPYSGGFVYVDASHI